ncbi:MAG: UpxY family transcription antiterminator [Alphaproteobacteria bacterium]|uniref:UpxY family transcription antiterminator n=1 Tax=Candidatus Nitrobium versatile TaxID=2884831 RepID=A0A953M422_9BACT|nr:UpxY family transcription antiterminator [Candidatus Nitrobium versatile]
MMTQRSAQDVVTENSGYTRKMVMTEGIKDELANSQFWFAVQVRSRHEFKVAEQLIRAGIDAFLPTFEKLSAWKDRRKKINFPLFPGYLFAHIEKEPAVLRAVIKTSGIVRFLGLIPGEPEIIPDDQINSLKRLMESKEELDPYPYLQNGRKYRIRRGPLAGVEGILIERLDCHRLVLSVDVLRQGVSLKVEAADIEAV